MLPERAVPNPQLLPALEPRWLPRGPARRREKLGRRRYSPRFAHVLKAVTGENEVPEVDGEPVDEAVLQEGSSHTLPISREGTEDVQAAGAPSKGRAQSSVADGAGGEEHTKGIYIKDVPMFCLKGAIGVFVPVLLIIIVCCICIRRRRQKHQRLMESAKARAAARKRSAWAAGQTAKSGQTISAPEGSTCARMFCPGSAERQHVAAPQTEMADSQGTSGLHVCLDVLPGFCRAPGHRRLPGPRVPCLGCPQRSLCGFQPGRLHRE